MTSKSDSAERGVVKWFNDAKGFGFIEREDGKDVFVHYSSIESEGFKTLKDGEEVFYEMQQGDKGLHAVQVRRTSDPAPLEHTPGSETEIIIMDENPEAGTI